jgi:HK97 family phage major capsid protein
MAKQLPQDSIRWWIEKGRVATELKSFLIREGKVPLGAADKEIREKTLVMFCNDELTAEQFKNYVKLGMGQRKANLNKELDQIIGAKDMADKADMDTIYKLVNEAGKGGGEHIRVKKPSEQYLTTKSVGRHIKTGEPVTFEGRQLLEPSELQLAKVGAWAKHAMRSGRNAEILGAKGHPVPQLSEHEEHLVAEMLVTDKWCGLAADGKWCNGASVQELGLSTKSLLNDATSGGNSLVPYDFDDAIITYAVLNGEVLPYVDLKSTSRDEVKTSDMSNPTVQWGTNEGSAISLFDTDGMCSPISQNVYPVSVAIEYGRDLLSDSPVAVGALLQQQIGQVMLKEMDDVICNGNGTTQPQGFFNASGTRTANSDNSNAGPATLDDYETLMFAIGKQYRRRELNPSFVSNDTTYQRSRAIKIDPSDPTTNQLPVFGLGSIQSYSTLEWPHRIQNDIANTKLAFICLKMYRLWRRTGFEFRIVTEDADLARKNEVLLLCRGRYAGQLVNPEACALMTDCQS